MNKYIKGIFCVPLASLKFLILKVEKGNNFKARFPAILSPLTEISVTGESCLYIGKMLKMHNGAKIRTRNDGKLSIGNNFSMNNGCIITAYDDIEIGENVMLGPNVLIYDHDHDYKAEGGVFSLKYKTSPVTIGNNVWIGANCVILRGTSIGDNCVIGGGCVLKGEYPSNSVIVQKRSTEVINYNARTDQNCA